MSSIMKLKTLQGHLEDLNGFSNPKIQFEQYETPAHLAATALYTIQTQFESIEGCTVLDAGCGPGIWGIGAALLGAGAVTAVDIDDEVLQVFKENVDEMEVTNIDAIQCDFLDSNVCRWEGYFDTVLMNPPFGTKNNAGMDMKFLRMGTVLSSDSVYSLHKSSTRSHIEKKIKDWGMKGAVIAQMKYELPATYRFHKQNSMNIAVDLWRVYHPH
ncbi:methyltransferase like 5 [Anticarsia gemmatalis]|uniref:methyltransferase like 5 n=1 Tax=Anticarsia gemmatalis TaxID=129554 RepID=UPI003F769A72